MNDNIITVEESVVLGPYRTKIEADIEAKNYLHPKVFEYRSALIPNPKTFGVKVKIKEANVEKDDNRDNSFIYPYIIKLVVIVEGKEKNVQNWIQELKNRMRPSIVL